MRFSLFNQKDIFSWATYFQQSASIDNVWSIFEVGIPSFDYKSNKMAYFDVFIPLGENAENPAQME